MKNSLELFSVELFFAWGGWFSRYFLQHLHMIKMSLVSFLKRDSVMDLRKCWHDTKKLFPTFGSLVRFCTLSKNGILFKIFYQVVLRHTSFMFCYRRTDIFCTCYWNGHYYCWARWWAIPCFADNCWWTGIHNFFSFEFTVCYCWKAGIFCCSAFSNSF